MAFQQRRGWGSRHGTGPQNRPPPGPSPPRPRGTWGSWGRRWSKGGWRFSERGRKSSRVNEVGERRGGSVRGRPRSLLCRLLCALNSVSCPPAPGGSLPTLLHPGGAQGCLSDLPPGAQQALPGLGRGAPEQTGRPWLWRCLLRLTGPAPTPCPGDRSLSPSSWLEAALAGEADCRRQVRRAVPAHGGAAVPRPSGPDWLTECWLLQGFTCLHLVKQMPGSNFLNNRVTLSLSWVLSSFLRSCFGVLDLEGRTCEMPAAPPRAVVWLPRAERVTFLFKACGRCSSVRGQESPH